MSGSGSSGGGGALRRLSAALVGAPTESLPGTPVADPVGAVAAALEQARLAGDGGAYVRIFSEAAASVSSSSPPDARPLGGVPLAIKDLIAVAGHRLGAGSALRDGAPAEPRDAAIVAALRDLGAVPVGMAALHELAFGVTGLNAHTGTPANPRSPERVPGGSSSGSAAAVAAGSARLALGTDTGGSVRIPAALCGVVGFKPGFGEYPIAGVLPLSPTLDHLGLIAADVAMVRRTHAALGHDPGAVALPRRVGYVEEQVTDAEPAVRDCVRQALDRLADAGAEVQSCGWPDTDRCGAASTLVMLPEAARVYGDDLARRPEQIGEDVRRLLAIGAAVDASSYAAGLRERARLRDEVAAVLGDVDVVLGPTVPVLPPRRVDVDDATAARLVRNTALLNVVGAPAISLPLAGAELPVGMQVVARSSALLLGAAAALEALLAQ